MYNPDKAKRVEAEVEQALESDPEPGSPHYMLLQMIDRVGISQDEHIPATVRSIPDEARMQYNQDFIRHGLMYLKTRDQFPQGGVTLARREVKLLEQCLHIAGMALQFHLAPRGSFTEKFAGQTLRDALNNEVERMKRLGTPTILMQMPALAALSAHLKVEADRIPKDFSHDD